MSAQGLLRSVLVGTAVLCFGACSITPRAGPDDTLIFKNATTVVGGAGKHTSSIEYALVDISHDILPFVTVEKPGAGLSSFGGGRGGAPQLMIGVGDVVQITIFESRGGGLFVPDDVGSARTGNFVTLPQQRVDGRGFITVPYAGRVRAVGRALPDIEADIVSKIQGVAIEPQVTISLNERNASNVVVNGDVEEPLRFELTDSGDTVLDAIARAGGLSGEDHDSFVTLTRDGRSATVYYPTLARSGSENVFLVPGDRVFIESERRRFGAFGATGQSGEFVFDREDLSLAEAVSKAGGLLDERADPGMVFVYRRENVDALFAMGADLQDLAYGRDTLATIYRANFRKPDAFFAAHEFQMRDGDVLYVSNADSIEMIKVLDLIGSVTSSVRGIGGDIKPIGDLY